MLLLSRLARQSQEQIADTVTGCVACFLPGIRFRIRLDNGKRLTTLLPPRLTRTSIPLLPRYHAILHPFVLSMQQNFVALAIKSGELGGLSACLGNQSTEVVQVDRQAAGEQVAGRMRRVLALPWRFSCYKVATSSVVCSVQRVFLFRPFGSLVP